MRHAVVAPLLVVEDVLVGRRGIVLLPAIPERGLHLGPGDTVDVVDGDDRDEVEVLGLERDRDPARVRLRVSSSVPIGVGCEVWRSQVQSHVVVADRERVPGGVAVSLSGAVPRRRA